ncbi:uncharacterized protein LOC134530504 [Bacillus rossius redtenbacheri]|uniref:uncharacterized protein LOC134530504 n=1 Tax=Bacillus rossius redtenbacheri TaxID=93214 RepID=UPI002FDE6CBC
MGFELLTGSLPFDPEDEGDLNIINQEPHSQPCLSPEAADSLRSQGRQHTWQSPVGEIWSKRQTAEARGNSWNKMLTAGAKGRQSEHEADSWSKSQTAGARGRQLEQEAEQMEHEADSWSKRLNS